MNKDQLWQKIKITYSYFQRSSGWYTGLDIKKYLRKKIFSLNPDFDNKNISSGRWSSYCHYSSLIAFQNLLDKADLGKGRQVLVYPLLPDYFIQE